MPTLRALWTTIALLAGCGAPFTAAPGEPAPAGAGPCPDEPACEEACRERQELLGACGWSWGEPECVCGPAPCRASACYGGEGVAACGVSPDGEDVAACLGSW